MKVPEGFYHKSCFISPSMTFEVIPHLFKNLVLLRLKSFTAHTTHPFSGEVEQIIKILFVFENTKFTLGFSGFFLACSNCFCFLVKSFLALSTFLLKGSPCFAA
jgi:hypothetical protein